MLFRSAKKASEEGAYFIHPFDDDQIISGQGTACYEALQELQNIDAVFVSCGGGGLISGTLLATKLFSNNIKVFGGEPENCNDAAISLRQKKLHIFDTLPVTIADGIRTLSISERTFSYLKKSKGIIETSEEEIIYWTQWIQHLLKTACEPSSAVAEMLSPSTVILSPVPGAATISSLTSDWPTTVNSTIPDSVSSS